MGCFIFGLAPLTLVITSGILPFTTLIVYTISVVNKNELENLEEE